MARLLTVGVLQLSSSTSKEEAVKKIRRLIGERGRVNADLIVMPEYSMVDPTDLEPWRLYEVAEDINGAWVNELSRLSRVHDSCIVGTMFERSGRPPKVFNTAFVVSPEDGVISVYRKTHLFDAYGFRESDKMLAGSDPPRPVKACGAVIGLAICFELRFPELFRLLALGGAEVVVVPSGWYAGHLKEEALRVLSASRAHENGLYVVVPVLYGDRFTGRSMIVNPFGVVELDLGVGEKYVEHTIDLDMVERAREQLPVLRLRRPELYEGLCSGGRKPL